MTIPTLLRPLAALALATLAGTAAAQTQEPGDLWEVTTKMSMPGMEMPGHTSKVCSSKDWDKPPVATDERQNCTIADFKKTGTKASWTMRCDGPPLMTGHAEVDRNAPDHYAGWMKINMPQGTMTMTMDGKRIGDCDAGESKQQMAAITARANAIKQQAASAQTFACQQAVTSMNLNTLAMAGGPCTDPSSKTAYCDRLKTQEGFQMAKAQASTPGNGLAQATAFCGTDLGTVKAKVCGDALAADALDFIATECPDQARPIAQRECSGRDYTAMMASRYRAFCTAYSRAQLSGR